jgi:hypothetical protein
VHVARITKGSSTGGHDRRYLFEELTVNGGYIDNGILPAGSFVERKALGRVVCLQQFEKEPHCQGQRPSRHFVLIFASRADCYMDVPQRLPNWWYPERQSMSG